MGLPSSINLRVAQVDPTSLIAAPSRTSDNSDSSSAFAQHLDQTETPADRAIARRDEQRQRDRASDNSSSKDSASASSSSSQSAPEPVTSSNTAAPTDPQADAASDASTPAASSTDTAATTTQPASDASKASDTSGTADPTKAAADAAASAGEADAAALTDQPVVAGPVKDTTKAQAKPEDDGKKADTRTDDATLAAVLIAQPVAQQKVAVKATTAGTAVKTDAIAPAPAPVAQPVAPAEAALAAAAAAQSAKGDAQTDQSNTGADTDGDGDLAVKPTVEGLGHQAAADMADKTSKDGATAAQVVQPAAPQIAAIPTATNFAAKTADSAGGTAAVEGVSATGTSDGTLSAQLSDLQKTDASQQTNANGTTIRIGTLPGQTTPSIVPSMAIALQIARNLQKGVNRFDIRLDPAELGRIDVRMEVQKDGHVAAHMTVEQASTLDLLQRDSRSLQQALNDAGLQANADSLSFSLRDQNADANAQGSSGGGNANTGSNDVATVDDVVKSPVYNINLSASGGVDIRV